MAGKSLLFIFLVSCSSFNLKELRSSSRNYVEGQYVVALEHLDKANLSKAKSSLLYYLEKGMIYFRDGAFKSAADEFQKAKYLVEQLEVKNFSHRGKVTLRSYKSRDFFGEDFERSYLHYYLALSYLNLYLEGKDHRLGKDKVHEYSFSDRRGYLFSARAEIMAWDIFFEQIKKSNEKSLYFTDTHFRLLAGLIHELIGGSAEKEIARKHYQNALESLDKINSLYRNFNPNADAYANKFFSSLKNNKVKPVFVNHRKRSLELREYFKERLKKLKTISKNEEVFLFIDYGIVPEKKAKKIDLSINALFRSDQPMGTKLVGLISDVAFKSYLYNTLGMRSYGIYLGRRNPYIYDYYSSRHFSVATPGPAFQFEIPVVQNKISNRTFQLEVYKSGSSSPTVVKDVFLSSSLGEISKVTNKQRAGDYLLSNGARFLTKKLMSIGASYLSYKALKNNKKNNELAAFAGLATFWTGNALASHSEKADVRSWSFLPKEIYFSRLSLQPGNYTLKVKDKGLKAYVFEKTFLLKKGNSKIFPIDLKKI